MPPLRYPDPTPRPASARRCLGAAAALAVIVLVSGAGRAGAATFIVNSTADTDDTACTTDAGGCTLREAINAAVATPGRDTIKFDPTVFPKAPPVSEIFVTTALPVIADPAGTVVDGLGTYAGIITNNPGVLDGLVFASAPGVALAKATVANVIIGGFTANGVRICGGTPPNCDADVTKAVVQNVAVGGVHGDGIRIEGRNVNKARILNSTVWNSGDNNSSAGIRIAGGTSIVGARVQA